MEIRKVAVVGAGTMGGGIAQLLSYADIPVVMKDIDAQALEAGLAHARSIYTGQVRKGRMSEAQVEAKLKLITPTLDDMPLRDADLVIEAVPEVLDLKRRVFGELDRLVKPGALLVSNTSSLPIAALAAATGRPDKVAGFHFFNPVHVMKLVEVIYTPQTAEKTIAALVALAQRLNKLPVKVKDAPGFLVNRILAPYTIEAVNALVEGVATVAQIDGDCRAWGMPMGPFTLTDMVGLDVSMHVGKTLVDAYGVRFAANPLIPRMVEAGRLGQKAGKGFYQDGEPADLGALIAAARAEQVYPAAGRYGVERIMLRLINEAAYAVGEGIASARDADLAMIAGTGFSYQGERIGPLAVADRLGLEQVLATLREYQALYGDAFAPAPLLEQRVAEGATGVAAGRGFHSYGLFGAEVRREHDAVPGIHLERAEHVALLLLDNPPVNALSLRMMARLDELVAQLQDDATVRVVLIASAGQSAFVAGADIREFPEQFGGGPEQTLAQVRRTQAIFNRLAQFPKPVIAVIDGVAYGGGLELALACHLRLAGVSARFALPEITLGIIPAWGGTQRLPALIGRARALEMMLSGDPITAEEALAWGLVNRVLPDDELLSGAQRFAEHLASRAPLAAQAILDLTRPDLADAIDGEAQALVRLATTADAAEGITAFLEKRPARFTGR